jgi:hypothetical protein
VSSEQPVGTVRLTRRRLLARGLGGTAGVLAGPWLAGCDWSADGEAVPGPEQPSMTGPLYTNDVMLLAAAVTDEWALLDTCRATVTSYPALAALVRPIEQRQQLHIDGLSNAAEDPLPLGAHRAAAVPRRLPLARRALVQALSAASERRTQDCMAADAGLLARLFGSVAASHAATVEHLRLGL